MGGIREGSGQFRAIQSAEPESAPEQCKRDDPGWRGIGAEWNAQHRHGRPVRGRLDHLVMRRFDQQYQAGQAHQHRHGHHGIMRQDAQQRAALPQRQMQHDQPGHASWRKHHHADEDQAEIQHPGPGDVGQHHLQQRHQHGAHDRAEEMSDAADIGHQQHDTRLRARDVHGVHQLEIDRRQPTGDTGEKARDAERDEAHHLG